MPWLIAMADCRMHLGGWNPHHFLIFENLNGKKTTVSNQPRYTIGVYVYIYIILYYIYIKRPGHGSRLDPTTAKTAPLSRLSHECLRRSPHLKETQGHMTPVRWRMGAAFKLPVIWKTTNLEQKQNKQQAPKTTRIQTTRNQTEPAGRKRITIGKGKLSFSLQTFAPRWNQDRAVQWLDRCTFQWT